MNAVVTQNIGTHARLQCRVIGSAHREIRRPVDFKHMDGKNEIAIADPDTATGDLDERLGVAEGAVGDGQIHVAIVLPGTAVCRILIGGDDHRARDFQILAPASRVARVAPNHEPVEDDTRRTDMKHGLGIVGCGKADRCIGHVARPGRAEDPLPRGGDLKRGADHMAPHDHDVSTAVERPLQGHRVIRRVVTNGTEIIRRNEVGELVRNTPRHGIVKRSFIVRFDRHIHCSRLHYRAQSLNIFTLLIILI